MELLKCVSERMIAVGVRRQRTRSEDVMYGRKDVRRPEEILEERKK